MTGLAAIPEPAVRDGNSEFQGIIPPYTPHRRARTGADGRAPAAAAVVFTLSKTAPIVRPNGTAAKANSAAPARISVRRDPNGDE